MNLTINLHATPRTVSNEFEEEQTFLNLNPWVVEHYEPNPVSGVSYLRVVIRETEYVYDWGQSDVVSTRDVVMFFKDDDDGLPYHLKLYWTEKHTDDTTCYYEVRRISTVWAHPDEPFENAPFHKY